MQRRLAKIEVCLSGIATPSDIAVHLEEIYDGIQQKKSEALVD